MEDYSRSRSYSDGRNNMQMEVYGSSNNRGPSYDVRSYNTSYAASYVYHENNNNNNNNNNYGQPPKELKLKKGKSSWSLIKDPELQRKKRVASYKVYTVEGKVKGSFRKSFRWLKDKYTQVLYGWW